jgi:hypothetical protein
MEESGSQSSDGEDNDSEDNVAAPEKPPPRKKSQPAERVPRTVVRPAKQQQLGELSFTTEESGIELDLPVSSKAGKRASTHLNISDEEEEEDDVAAPEKPPPRRKAQPAERVPRTVVRSAKQQQLGELSFFVF